MKIWINFSSSTLKSKTSRCILTCEIESYSTNEMKFTAFIVVGRLFTTTQDTNDLRDKEWKLLRFFIQPSPLQETTGKFSFFHLNINLHCASNFSNYVTIQLRIRSSLWTIATMVSFLDSFIYFTRTVLA